MAEKLGGSEGGFEIFIKRDERAEAKVRTPQEIEEGIQSTPTVSWDPFTVLPKEIYFKILDKLDNPTDQQNFMNAHSKWYELFKGERVKFLFGKVFEDLPLEEVTSEYDVTPDTNIKGLRLVCREWDKSIQNYYQLHPYHFDFRIMFDDWFRTSSKHLKIQYANGYSIPGRHRNPQTDMMEFLASHPPSRNPFLTRKIYIQIMWRQEYLDEAERLCSLVDTLLENYGHHIWHFAFRTCTKPTPPMYSRILKWLRLLPELRTLHMKFYYMTGGQLSPFEIHRLKNIIDKDTPQLRKLQYLRVSKLPYFAFNKLLEGTTAVEKVQINFQNSQLDFQLPLTTSLTEAALIFDGTEDIKYLYKLEQFPVMRKLVIKIEEQYQFSYLPPYWSYSLDWKTVWNAIEEKFPALEDLYLTLPDAQAPSDRRTALEQSLECRLSLPNLKRLKVIFPNLSCLDFLQEMKGLCELEIYLDYYPKYQGNFQGSNDLVRKETVKFNKILGTMWESNIWSIFPNLRKLLIKKRMPSITHFYEKRSGGKRMYKMVKIISGREINLIRTCT